MDIVRRGRMIGVFRHSGVLYFSSHGHVYTIFICLICRGGIHACFSSNELFLMCL
jgi:hypothetical protein